MENFFLGLLGLCAIALVGLLGWLVFTFVDSVGTDNQNVTAKATSREFTPAWTQTIMVMVGKVMVPNFVHHPDKWEITAITNDNDVLTCEVSEEIYDDFMMSSLMTASISKGRFSGSIYCNSLY